MNTITINSFIILRELGTGGFGTVKLAKFDNLNLATQCNIPSTIALKKIILGKNVS
jgi:serine/threonine protein kinase